MDVLYGDSMYMHFLCVFIRMRYIRGQYLSQWVKSRAKVRRERGHHSEDIHNPHEKQSTAQSDKVSDITLILLCTLFNTHIYTYVFTY